MLVLLNMSEIVNFLNKIVHPDNVIHYAMGLALIQSIVFGLFTNLIPVYYAYESSRPEFCSDIYGNFQILFAYGLYVFQFFCGTYSICYFVELSFYKIKLFLTYKPSEFFYNLTQKIKNNFAYKYLKLHFLNSIIYKKIKYKINHRAIKKNVQQIIIDSPMYKNIPNELMGPYYTYIQQVIITINSTVYEKISSPIVQKKETEEQLKAEALEFEPWTYNPNKTEKYQYDLACFIKPPVKISDRNPVNPYHEYDDKVISYVFYAFCFNWVNVIYLLMPFYLSWFYQEEYEQIFSIDAPSYYLNEVLFLGIIISAFLSFYSELKHWWKFARFPFRLLSVQSDNKLKWMQLGHVSEFTWHYRHVLSSDELFFRCLFFYSVILFFISMAFISESTLRSGLTNMTVIEGMRIPPNFPIWNPVRTEVQIVLIFLCWYVYIQKWSVIIPLLKFEHPLNDEWVRHGRMISLELLCAVENELYHEWMWERFFWDREKTFRD